MLRRFQFSNNLLVQSESADCPVLVFINPEPSERNTLITEYQIDEHTLSSALDPDELSRIEFSSDRLCLIWKRPMNYSGQDNFFFNVASVGLFLIKERLIVVTTEDIPLTGAFARGIPRIESPLDVLFNFLYNTVHHYLEHLKVMKMISRDTHERINTSLENRHLIQMFNLTESLVYYANAINSNDAVLTRLRTHADKLNLAPQTIEYLDDLIIENNQCFQQAEIYTRVFSALMDARGNLVNNNMNVLLKKLTIINVIFLPLNLIASIGGMSEFTMMTEVINWRISYSLFGLAMLVLALLTAFFLRRMGVASNASTKPRRKRKGS